ncbi:PHP domain-containing protein [Paeniglutamicibacter kerguelensis]|uniref:Metal-dependent phosphoesterase TrpH n=1 Tax=Paeniglutamicibacter kerguelensis TaxID=254788 RepID=A0ABS4XED5_9MICC|nr:PHP domain-containing protein [Paeniglutamicibacter kerguelensis]MBP2386748.1 putative metal-dependent phosphoesterase TrpH [Paeniglutamicibacter kerguelensis]
MRIDLHTHSHISDGTESPADLVTAAAAAGLDVVALTDHDQTAGWADASARALELGIGLVPGMEISCKTDRGISVHLLSYLHDPAHLGLLEEIEKARDARITRARRMVELLAEDYPVDWELVSKHSVPGATIGRPHIADALVTAGVVRTRTEAFAQVLTARSRYYVGHYAMDPVTAVRLVREAGGVPVFAHPVASARGRIVGEETYKEMIEAGLLGLEIEHRDNPEEGRKYLRALAERHNLIVTGSSDYHGTGKTNLLGENTTAPEMLRRILAAGTGSRAVGIPDLS